MWKLVLYHSSIQGNHFPHFFGYLLQKHLRYVSRHLFTISIWLSIWGWKAMLFLNLVPWMVKNSFQNKLTKIVSIWHKWLRESMMFYTSHMNAATTCFAKNEWFKAMKWLYLLKRSTTTIMTSFPDDLGNPSMKSMEISSYTQCGVSNGCSNPPGARALLLFFWHITHFSTYAYTSFFMSCQNNSPIIGLYVLRYPKCPPIIESWNVCNNLGINTEDCEMTNLFL